MGTTCYVHHCGVASSVPHAGVDVASVSGNRSGKIEPGVAHETPADVGDCWSKLSVSQRKLLDPCNWRLHLEDTAMLASTG